MDWAAARCKAQIRCYASPSLASLRLAAHDTEALGNRGRTTPPAAGA